LNAPLCQIQGTYSLRELSREGIITTGGGGITVLDPDALTKAAGYETAWA